VGEIWLHEGGRLGNRLFQLASGHQISSKYGLKVYYFTDSLHGDDGHDKMFSDFIGNCKHIDGVFQNEFRGGLLRFSDFLFSRNESFFNLFNRSFGIYRSMNAFDSPMLPSIAPKLVSGFFINSQTILSAQNFEVELLEYLNGVSTVKELDISGDYQLVHVRGTDFKEGAYGSLSSDYYESLPLNKSSLYVITDDLDHAKSITKRLNVCRFLGPDEANPWQALALMSKSRRFFASNSTLSWWGAYLGALKNHEVFLPAPFYKDNNEVDKALFISLFNYVESHFH